MDKYEIKVRNKLYHLCSTYSNNSLLEWLTDYYLTSMKGYKANLVDMITSVICSSEQRNDKKLSNYGKRKIIFTYQKLLMYLCIRMVLETIKLKVISKEDDKKNKYLQEKYLTFKYLFYRGDGYPDQLIRVADKIYTPLDTRIKDILGYSYTDLKHFNMILLENITQTKMANINQLKEVMPSNIIDIIVKDFSMPKLSINTVDIYDYSENYSKPLVCVNNHIYVPAVGNLLYNLPKAMHYILLNLPKTYPELEHAKALKDDYTQIRGNQLELLVISYLMNKDRKLKIYHGLKYNTGEADVTVQMNKCTLLFEVKGKLLTLESYKSVRKSIDTDFYEAIQKAYEQAKRTEEWIESGNKFYCKDKPKKKFVLCKSERYYKICITADNFGSVAIELDKYLSLKPSDNVYPISINIFDLEYMLDKVRNIKQFIEYLDYRLKGYGWLAAIDELDIFNEFIKGNLLNGSKEHPVFICSRG